MKWGLDHREVWTTVVMELRRAIIVLLVAHNSRHRNKYVRHNTMITNDRTYDPERHQWRSPQLANWISNPPRQNGN
jgi:hypothetical protein